MAGISENLGDSPLQFTWSSLNGLHEPARHMLHSDPYQALLLALGTTLFIYRNGKLDRKVDTRREMNDLADLCRIMTPKEWPPQWRAQRAMVKSEFLARRNFRRAFNSAIRKEMDECKFDAST